MRRLGAVLAAAALAAGVAACGGGGGDALEVRSETVADETTRDVLVFAPATEGSWPVVVAYHGINGTADDMAELATRVAGEGYVVFAPNYRSDDLRSEEGKTRAALDGECGYRFARSIASRYGGDLDEPVTFVGWSLGASMALALGLTEQLDPTGELVTCFDPAPRPDVVVAVSGCHYEYQGTPTGYLDVSTWDHKDASVVLVGAEKDTTCTALQSERAADELGAAGFDVDLVMLAGATHVAPVFHTSTGGPMVVDADAPAGERTVEVIDDAVRARREERA